MFIATKGEEKVRLFNDVQAAAFKNQEWNVSEEKAAPANSLSDLNSVRAEADALGIKYHPNMSDDNLKKKIEEFKNQ